jgi:hypothetical protein
LYLVLIYSQQQNLNANSGAPIQSSDQQQNLNVNSALVSNQIGQFNQTFIPISTKLDIKAILEPNPDFIVKGISVTKDSLNDLVIVGEIQNTAQVEKQFVKFVVTAYDANNAILASDFTYTEPDTLQAGQTGPFKDYINSESVSGDINSIKSLKIALDSG